MNKKLKKFMSVILCAVMLFTMPSVAFAAEDNAEVLEKNYACHYYNSMDFIVVTFDSKYSEIGEKPEVQLYNNSTAYPVEEDLITLKIFEKDGKRYPQLFVNTEGYDNITGIVIGTGAFVTQSGEISGKIDKSNGKIQQFDKLGLPCEFEAFEVDKPLTRTDFLYYTTVGKTIKIAGYNKYGGEVWINEITATYTLNGKTTQINSNEFVPQEPGKYVVELKLDSVFTKTFEIEVLSEKKAYSKNLGNATAWLFISPLYAVFGTVMLLVPGFGMVMGGFTWYSVGNMVTDFFTAISDGPVYKEYRLS